MTVEIPDEYLPLIIRALDNQYTASQVLNRQDDRYRDMAKLLRDAVERKGPGSEKSTVKSRRGRQTA
jgi:hypothetical protein